MKKKLNLVELLSCLQHYANRRWLFQDVFTVMIHDFDMPKEPEVKELLRKEYDKLCVYKSEIRNRYGSL